MENTKDSKIFAGTQMNKNEVNIYNTSVDKTQAKIASSKFLSFDDVTGGNKVIVNKSVCFMGKKYFDMLFINYLSRFWR